jgi:predicted nucleic acid-binding protein
LSRIYKLIVTDTSPLITLALANELDVLLRAGVPIEIPDAVYIEATRVRTAPGANQIGAWINDHSDLVRIVPTETGIDQQRRLEEGRPIRGLGEQASIEALDIFLAKNPDAQALLLFEDTDISKRRAIVDERVSLISTGDFLRELQAAHLIQSAEHILDEAARSGRNVERLREPGADADARETLRRQLQDRQRDVPGMER